MRKLYRLGLVVLLGLALIGAIVASAQDEEELPEIEMPADVELLSEGTPPRGATGSFSTDFSLHTVPYSDILSGGPPKDGIPAIDDPAFVNTEGADEWLGPQEPVILFKVGDDARAYPLQILMWHEIVNDTVGGKPVSVTFCPLCNTAIAFDRTVEVNSDGDEIVLDFGTTGRLRYSNLVMYDRQTETWWQQATGEAIAGVLVGRSLDFLPASIIAWEDFKDSYGDGLVLSRDTGYRRSYGVNPYAGYDDVNSAPWAYTGPVTPDTLRAMDRVLTLDLGEEAVAYPYRVMEQVQVVNDTVAGEPVVVIWTPGVASALDSGNIAEGRDVGTVVAFSAELDGDVLTFHVDDGNIVDDQTGSTWNVFGEATGGPLAGESLAPLPGINHFWFSWAAFRPETRVYTPDSES